MKRILALVISLIMVLSLCACGSTATSETSAASGQGVTTTEAEVLQVGIVTDMSIDSAEWLQNLVKGLEEYNAEHEDISIKIVESSDVAEYEPKVRALAEAGYGVIITMNSGLAGPTVAVAKDYPDIKFLSQNGNIENLESYSNIEEFGLNRTETGFMAGVVGAMMSESNVVGIVLGSDEPDLNAIGAGWQQGLVWAKPEITDYLVYSNTFSDPTTGQELGLALIDKGCDVIAGAAGGTGVGVAQAAADKGVKYVAWDVHYPEVFTGEQLELGSAVNWFDIMYLAVIDDILKGEYKPGEFVEYGIDKGVCAFEFAEGATISDEAKAKFDEAYDLIVNKEIEISKEPLHK